MLRLLSQLSSTTTRGARLRRFSWIEILGAMLTSKDL